MDSKFTLENVTKEWDSITAAIEKRNDLFKKLVSIVHATVEDNHKLRARCDRLDRENANLDVLLKDANARYESREHQLARTPFIVVIIDGDITKFCDTYVQSGVEGGRRAAGHLFSFIKNNLTKEKGMKDDWEIVVRIYVSMEKLAEAYRVAGLRTWDASFRDFVKGFNAERRLFECIDAGNDKEAADRKVQKNFELFWHNRHCKALVLGISGDRSYTGFLREYTQCEEDCQRIILLRGLPFTRDMELIAGRLCTISDHSLFRDTDFSGPTSSTDTPPCRRDSPIASYAVALAAAQKPGALLSNNVTVNTNGIINDVSARSPKELQMIKFNKDGQRIDEPVKYDKQLRQRFLTMEKKLCLDNYLAHCNRPVCHFSHEEVLTTAGRNTLLWMARMTPCQYTDCNYASCYLGHRCPWDGHCDKPDCRFGKDMHNVDMRVVSKRIGRA
ncbi:hypothetical protein M433DRAFT_114820 [Acidomyces richmondensis BFW]|nr:MAG: hypothetical protein FE78DRAFT_160253 [Acidomyces sp. 'richmondensis']KYG41952.1 hypothetical protein M433DRAFT_114820 [Acidomyces richmondensis BFW]